MPTSHRLDTLTSEGVPAVLKSLAPVADLESSTLRREPQRAKPAPELLSVDRTAARAAPPRFGGRGGSHARATPLAQGIGAADMTFGTLLALLTLSTVIAAGLFHFLGCLRWLCRPPRPKQSRSPDGTPEVGLGHKSPYSISVESCSLLPGSELTSTSTKKSTMVI